MSAQIPRGFVKVATLPGDGSTFSALRDAEEWAKLRGWSIGALERNYPVALLRDGAISVPLPKWSNISYSAQSMLDGAIRWPVDCRRGPAEIWVSREHAAAWEVAP
jgi:hypothetical protein